jgi:hypothetical protein
MKKNVRLYSEQNRHWWSNEKNTRWAIKDKEGIWWLVGGSEFPKKKTGEKKMQCGLPPTFDLKKIMWRIALGGFIGVALGLIIGFIILSI